MKILLKRSRLQAGRGINILRARANTLIEATGANGPSTTTEELHYNSGGVQIDIDGSGGIQYYHPSSSTYVQINSSGIYMEGSGGGTLYVQSSQLLGDIRLREVGYCDPTLGACKIRGFFSEPYIP